MEQINTFILFVLGRVLDSIYLSARRPIRENSGAWLTAQTVLRVLVRGDAKFKLNESASSAIALLGHLDGILDSFAKNPDHALTDHQVSSFNTSWSTFENALGLDLGRAPVFFVTKKGIYATPDLINNAELALAEEVGAAISVAARDDLNQAGRCLAFGIATASGFHALRAVEKVLRDYYELETGLKEIPNSKDQTKPKPLEKAGMAAVINALRAVGKGDKKTLGVVDQIRDLHRNPIDHPEIFLDPTEALELFNICTGAISAMTRQITKVKAAQLNP